MCRHLATGFGDIFALFVACFRLLCPHGTSYDALSQPPARNCRGSKGDAGEAPVQAGSEMQLGHAGDHAEKDEALMVKS